VLFSAARATPRNVKSYLELNLQILRWLFIMPLRGRWFSVGEVIHQIVAIGVRAIPMAALTAFSIGLTLAMQAAHQLQKLGAESLVSNLVTLSLFRELGPVLIAVIVIGRSCSAMTAELGTMKVSEEIEALEIMAINPVRFLVIPRILALMVMLPALTVFGDYLGLAGGWAICHFALDQSTASYVYNAIHAAEPFDFFSGIIKSVVFAWLAGTIACNAGLEVDGGAEGVGQSTTSSVVTCLLVMLASNAVITAIFFFA
jgi:phospholipid/cholesterol/gamma-HCH transport system permease protein